VKIQIIIQYNSTLKDETTDWIYLRTRNCRKVLIRINVIDVTLITQVKNRET